MKSAQANKVQVRTLLDICYKLVIADSEGVDYRQRVKDVIDAIEAVRNDIRQLKADNTGELSQRMGDLTTLECCLVDEAKGLLKQLGIST